MDCGVDIKSLNDIDCLRCCKFSFCVFALITDY